MTSRDSNSDQSTSPGNRALWIAIALLTGVVVGTAAGCLTCLGGVAVPLALVAGGAGFGATVGLFVALIKFVLGTD